MSKHVTVNTEGVEEALVEHIKKLAEKALSVAPEVPQIIRYRPVLHNEDADGKQMPMKQPRPKHSPRNNPNLPLVETGNLMDPGRWTVESTGEFERTIRYDPPDYHQYLVTKDPMHGGRKWLTQDQLNPNVRKAVEQKMVDKLTE